MTDSLNTDYADAVNRVWQRQIEFPQLLHYTDSLAVAGLRGLVAVLYRTWLQRHPGSSYNLFAWFNLGVVLFSDGDLEGAGQAYEQSLALSPDFVQSRFNLGLVRERQGESLHAD